MPGAYLWGWDATNEVWVKCIVNADGKLIINPTGFLENPPIEDQDKKAPTSEWAYDHWKNAAAHHAKYTDANSRAAIGDLLGSTGKLLKNLDCDFHHIYDVYMLRYKQSAADTHEGRLYAGSGLGNVRYAMWEIGVGYVDFNIQKYNGTITIMVIDQDNFQAELDNYLENPPTEDVANKAPTSEWAYDHWKNAAAHHAKYTDAEARASFYAGRILLETGVYTAESMTGVGQILLNTASGDVTLKGLADGVEGQMIFCFKVTNANDVHIIHASGDAAVGDKIYCVTAINESIVVGHYGGFWVIYSSGIWLVDHSLI